MTAPLYLIAHSVRGEAAFDVALQMECPHCTGRDLNDAHACFDCESLGYWWIIPTSGHRAFPYWTANLLDIDDTYELSLDCTSPLVEHPPRMPPAWPDHYRHGPSPKIDITTLFKAHRKGEAKPHIPRRL